MKIESMPALNAHVARYENTEATPLRVTAHLVAGVPVIAHDPIALDSILSWAVVHEATGGALLPQLEGHAAYHLPLPLQRAAAHDGLPVWCATPLFPDGDSTTDSVVECKRAQTGRWTAAKSGKFSIDPASGRWRARMIPRPGLIAERLVAHCIGDGDEVARLLRAVTHIGKRRASGGGLIERWTVEQGTPWAWVEDGRLTRSLPAALAERVGLTSRDATCLVAWTPPYWHRGLWAEGWSAETRMEEVIPCGTP